MRIRPISQKELSKDGVTYTARCVDEHTVLTNDPTDEFNEDVLRKDRPKEKIYTFDYVFGEESTQEQVFEATTKNLIDSVLQGFNATVFAYGLSITKEQAYNLTYFRCYWSGENAYNGRNRVAKRNNAFDITRAIQ